MRWRLQFISISGILLALTAVGLGGLSLRWPAAVIICSHPRHILSNIGYILRWEILTLTLALGTLFLGLAVARTLMKRRRHSAERLQSILMRLGEARGRQAVLDEVRMLEHAQLKAHVMATQRCLVQAQAAADASERARWLDEGVAQSGRLLQVVVGLHHAASDSALPGDLEQTARDTVVSLAVAYPTCTCTFEVCGPRALRIDDVVQRAIVLVLYNALHNAYTHGHPSSVLVQIQYAPDALILVVRDNGVGVTEAVHPGQGRGLSDMEQFMARFSGELRIESTPTRGTVVTATVPLTIEGDHDVSTWQALASQSINHTTARSPTATVAARRGGAVSSGH